MCVGNKLEDISYREEKNIFIKLLMISNSDKDFLLLYGFSVPTNQPFYPWRFRNVEETQQSIWSAILSPVDAEIFIDSLTKSSQITFGNKSFDSPILIKRPVVLSCDGQNTIAGPVSKFCKVTEYWNVHKKDLFQKVQSSFCADGKELYEHIQNLLSWINEECGIDFSKNGTRLGNFEAYDFPLYEDAFDIEINKECSMKKTIISKRKLFAKDLIVNCTAEHRDRSVLNQTKLFRAEAQHLDFYADEPMSRVVIQIWEGDSGELIFSKDLTLIMSMSLGIIIGSPIYRVRDPWSDKLFKSAASRSDVIKKQIETVSKKTQERALTINNSTCNAIDAAIDDSRTLFSVYQQRHSKGAFIPNKQKDGEINSFIKIREYIEPSSVKRAIIADPYFSVESAQKLLTRIPRTDIQIDIITSLTDTDPDTNVNDADICGKYRKILNDNVSILHNNLLIRNLKRGKEPVFHDRYLIRFFDDGRIDGFLLSNSLNSMGRFYPFVIAPMDQVVCYEVCDYLDFMCDKKKQLNLPVKERIECDVLCDFRSSHRTKKSIQRESFPFDLWLHTWCVNGKGLKIAKEQLECAINTLWEHWSEEKTLTCKMISSLGSTTYPWSVKDLSLIVKRINGAESEFLQEFIKIAKEKEQQQNYASYGLNSDIYTRRALLNNNAEPCRQGFSMLFDEAGHIWYAGDNWLKGGYTLMLQLSQSRFIELLDEIKSPLMLDVLATQMLLFPWSENLYITAMKSSNICIRLLCAVYAFYQLKENRFNIVQLRNIISNLSPKASILQLSYLLSQLVFYIRTSRSIKSKMEEINSIYDWMLKVLANNLPLCNEDAQETALHWLFDCEVCSNCRLHLALAEEVSDASVKEKIYRTVISAAEHDLTTKTYTRDITELINLYLQALDALYGDKGETKLLGHIINWHVFETATEPSLKVYAYPKWSSANTRAQWQLCILKEYVSHHPSSLKAKEWLDEWGPRISAISES